MLEKTAHRANLQNTRRGPKVGQLGSGTPALTMLTDTATLPHSKPEVPAFPELHWYRVIHPMTFANRRDQQRHLLSI